MSCCEPSTSPAFSAQTASAPGSMAASPSWSCLLPFPFPPPHPASLKVLAEKESGGFPPCLRPLGCAPAAVVLLSFKGGAVKASFAYANTSGRAAASPFVHRSRLLPTLRRLLLDLQSEFKGQSFTFPNQCVSSSSSRAGLAGPGPAAAGRGGGRGGGGGGELVAWGGGGLLAAALDAGPPRPLLPPPPARLWSGAIGPA